MTPKERLQQLLLDAKVALTAAEKIQEKTGDERLSEEEDQKVQGFLGEYDRCMAAAETLKRTVSAREELEAPVGTKAAATQWRESSQDEGLEEVDEKSWQEVEIQTAQVHPIFGLIPVMKTIRFNTPKRILGLKGYDSAFENYLRKGINAISAMYPADYKTLTEGVDSAGGFITPAEMQASIIKKIATLATVRANARIIQTSKDLVQWPKIRYTDDDKYTSGVRITWTGEQPAASTDHRVTDPIFGMYQIPVHTAMASMPLSRDLIEDAAFDVVGLATEFMSEAFVLGENDKFWIGTGAGEPMGITSRISSDTDVGADEIAFIASLGAANITDPADLINVWAELPSQYELNAKWYFRKATEAVIRKLTDTDGNFIWPVWPQVGNLGVHPREIMGFPTVRDEFVPAIAGDAHPVIFGDMNAYLVADRVGMSVERLTEHYAELNIHLLLGRKRVGGDVIEPWRLKALKTVAST